MKNILLLVHDDAGQEARLQVALDLGRALNGHLTCVDVLWTPPIIGSGYYDDAYAVADVLTCEEARESANRQKLEGRLAHEDVSWNLVEVSGDFGPSVERSAGLADVIVVNRALDRADLLGMRRTAGSLIVRSGKPVVAVPPDGKRLDLTSALVAWDGSAAAAAALRAAVPLLQLAERVTILEIDDGSVRAPAEDAASYLSRHGVHSAILRVPANRNGAGEALLEEASRGRHGYIVMGGFSHARWLESLFGGVTRMMLTSSPIPVFLAH